MNILDCARSMVNYCPPISSRKSNKNNNTLKTTKIPSHPLKSRKWEKVKILGLVTLAVTTVALLTFSGLGIFTLATGSTLFAIPSLAALHYQIIVISAGAVGVISSIALIVLLCKYNTPSKKKESPPQFESGYEIFNKLMEQYTNQKSPSSKDNYNDVDPNIVSKSNPPTPKVNENIPTIPVQPLKEEIKKENSPKANSPKINSPSSNSTVFEKVILFNADELNLNAEVVTNNKPTSSPTLSPSSQTTESKEGNEKKEEKDIQTTLERTITRENSIKPFAIKKEKTKENQLAVKLSIILKNQKNS